MNSVNDTVVSGEFYRKLREAQLAGDYEQVPRNMQGEVNRHLAGRDVADMTPVLKLRLTRNQQKAKRRAGVPGY